jgi:DNA-binding response OmpR family regulator
MNSRKKILIIDDEPMILDLMEKILCRKYNVVLSGDCETAMKWAETTNFDLIITDLSMPGIDGFEIYRRFSDKIPIVIMTGRTDFDDSQIDNFKMIHKPMAINEVEEKVDHLLRLA